jgi:hypothetical protein
MIPFEETAQLSQLPLYLGTDKLAHISEIGLCRLHASCPPRNIMLVSETT